MCQTSRINQNQWTLWNSRPVIWIENNTRDSIDTEERMAEIGIFDRTVPLRNSAAIYSDNNIEYVSSLSGTDRSLSGRPWRRRRTQPKTETSGLLCLTDRRRHLQRLTAEKEADLVSSVKSQGRLQIPASWFWHCSELQTEVVVRRSVDASLPPLNQYI